MSDGRLFNIEDFELSESDKNEFNKIVLSILLDISKLIEKAESKIDQVKSDSLQPENYQINILKIKASTYDAIDDLILNIV